MSDSRWDAVVIGSGLGGLTTAAYLAANGKRTLLLEQYDVIGGNAHVFRRKEFEFEVGLHYIGDCGPQGNVPTLLGGLGLADKVEFLEMDRSGYDTLLFPDLTFKVPVGWDNYLANLIEAFPGEERALRGVVGVLERIGRLADRSTTPGSYRGMLEFAVKGRTAAAWALLPVTRLFDAYRLSPRARAVIGAQWGQHGCPPSRAPLSLHAGLLHNYIGGGAWFPRGGSQVIPARLAEVVRAHGGSIRTQARVEQILVEGGRVTGVRLRGGEVLHAPVVVSNADIKRTYLEMVGPEHLSRRAVRRVDGYRMSAPFVNVYLGLDVDLREHMPNTNYFAFGSWDNGEAPYRELIQQATAHDPQEWMRKAEANRFAFIHSASVKDPYHSYAPAGGSSLEVMTLAPPQHDFWGMSQGGPAAGERYRRTAQYLERKEQITELLVQSAVDAIPAIAGHIVWQESATPITQERYTLASGGSAYGIECNTGQFGPFRPGAGTEIRGLYLAGASTAWGPSIEGAMISGTQAAGAVLGRNLVAEVRSGRVFGDPAGLPDHGPDWDPLKDSRNLGRPPRRGRTKVAA